MLDFDLNLNCYGCGSCFAACPRGAIRMLENQEGFPIPQIDPGRCVGCNICEKVCPFLNHVPFESAISDSRCHAAYLVDGKTRMQSTSGGIFYALARNFIKQGGLVAGCVWNENMEAVHILTDSLEQVQRMRGSKYVQSRTEECFQKIQESLKAGKKVLFCGTPCQVGGLLLLTGNPDNLFTCALICEGVPSPKVWRRYVEDIEKQNGSTLKDVHMRRKGNPGWKAPLFLVEFGNGKSFVSLYFANLYIRGFNSSIFMRNSCFHCQYKGDRLNADMVIGDFWGAPEKLIAKSENKGLSAVLIRTDKGTGMFERITHEVFSSAVTFHEVARNNQTLLHSVEPHKKRVSFFQRLDRVSLSENIKSNIERASVKTQLIVFLYHLGLYVPIQRIHSGLKRLSKGN